MMIATWTQERVEQLQSYVNAGLTCSQIADEIGVSRNAVIGKIHRLGLAPGRPAGRPAPERPPRHRRPRSLTQRGLLHLIYAQAPNAGDAAAVALAPSDSPQPCSLLELVEGKCRYPVDD